MTARRRNPWLSVASWRQVGLYGMLLAGGTFVLQWLDYRRMARAHSTEIAMALVAGLFLAVGVAVGMRLMARAPAPPLGNPQALAELGISPRELDVLCALAAGASNKEIARELGIAPSTVKTHVARLFEKLGASRRTDAIARARELGILP